MPDNPFSRAIVIAKHCLWEATPRWVRRLFLADIVAGLVHVVETTSNKAELPTSALSVKGSSGQTIIADCVLPKSVLLERVISVPPANTAQQAKIAELDMLRRTPFSPQDVYYAIGKLPGNGPGQLKQWIAKKTDILRFRSNLRTHGLNVRRFLVEDGTRQVIIADFSAQVAPYQQRIRRWNGLFASIAIIAATAIWLIPAFHSRAETIARTASVDALRSQALSLRAEIVSLEEADATRLAFVENILRRPRAVDTLRQVTVVLPDEVWAFEMTITKDRVAISGETSQSAAALVLALTEADVGYTPSLTGPVSRTAGGKERFLLTLQGKGSTQ